VILPGSLKVIARNKQAQKAPYSYACLVGKYARVIVVANVLREDLMITITSPTTKVKNEVQ
jgi:hypothetical protein